MDNIKNALLLIPKMPYPPYEDGSILIYYYLTKYIKNLNIVCFEEDGREKANCFDGHFTNYCEDQNIMTLKVNKMKSNITVLNGYDLDMNNYFNPKGLEYILGYIRRNGINEILCNIALIRYAEEIKKHTSCSVYLHSIDAKSMVEKSKLFYGGYKDKLKSIIKYVIYRRLERRFEKFDKILVVSDHDKNYLVRTSKVKEEKILVIPNGVDIDHFKYKIVANKQERSEVKIGFSGILDYAPNEEAVLSFLVNTLPKVLKHFPFTEFWIIGKNPTERITNTARGFGDKVKVTGFVEDIRSYISMLDIYISPLKSGGGIKNKILEAMALGPSVIPSELSMAGIEYDDEVMIYRNDDELFNKISYLIENPGERSELSQRARQLVENKHSWKKRAEEYISVFNQLKDT